MSTEAATVPMEAYALRESIALREGSGQGDGVFLVEVMRPCVGRGKGRHLYEAPMLRDNAHKFAGWKMYVDHQSDAARRAAGGLPRSVRDYGGRIVESYWDPSVPAEGRFGAGAVMGKVRPAPFVNELLEHDPGALDVSINARATSVRPVDAEGGRAWLVEGIEDRGTVDWVTEGGAGGGKVRALLEAMSEDPEEAEKEMLETMDDDELRAYLREERPGVLAEGDTKGDTGSEESGSGGWKDDPKVKAWVAKWMKGGMPEAMAWKAAQKKHANSKDGSDELTEAEALADEQDDADPTPADDGDLFDLTETSMDRDDLIDLIREETRTLVESTMDDERDLIRAEAKAEADRQVQLRDLRDEARIVIEAARLPAACKARLTSRFALVEGAPTDDLDVTDLVDEDGAVVVSASEVLEEGLALAIEEERTLVSELAPTRVRGQGSKDRGQDRAPSDEKPKASLWRSVLQEAAVDPDKAYSA